jgi:hypothetical protein
MPLNTLAADTCASMPMTWPDALVLSTLSAGGLGFLALCVWLQHKKDGKEE